MRSCLTEGRGGEGTLCETSKGKLQNSIRLTSHLILFVVVFLFLSVSLIMNGPFKSRGESQGVSEDGALWRDVMYGYKVRGLALLEAFLSSFFLFIQRRLATCWSPRDLPVAAWRPDGNNPRSSP